MSTDPSLGGQPTQDPNSTAAASSSSSSSAASSGAAAPANNPQVAEAYNSQTIIHSLADFKEKAPKVYKQMLMGIAQSITSEMQKSQERLKKQMKERK
jgi:hypothetical protein